MRTVTVLLVLLSVSAAEAQERTPKAFPEATPALRASDPGGCVRGSASNALDAGMAYARVYTNGNLFWQYDPASPIGGAPTYTIPKTGRAGVAFTSVLWVGGMVSGELRMSASTYGQGSEGYELWPGPLDASGAPPTDCSAYDRVWSVSRADILAYEATGAATADLRDWPVHLGAPVADGDGIPGNYDIAAGDRPELYGDQTLFWVMNDRGNTHRSTGTEPLGLEVRVAAFAVASGAPALREATFYRYTLVYRGQAPLEDAYLGFFNDFDIGEFSDDYLGTAPTRRMQYAYNGQPVDGGGVGPTTYGTTPPAAGLAFLSTPKGAPLAASTYWFSGGGAMNGPGVGAHYYNFLRGRWRDGTPFQFGGDGLNGTTGEPFPFVFPNAPPGYWSEVCRDGVTPGSTVGCTNSSIPSDRRGALSVGPFSLAPGEEVSFTVARVFARAENHLASVGALFAATDLVQAAYNAGALAEPSPTTLPAPVPATPLFANAEPGPFGLEWAAVPGADVYTVHVSRDPEFRSPQGFFSASNAVQITVPSGAPVYWRIRAEGPGALGQWSPTGTIVTRAGAGVARLPDGRPAFLEVVGPGGVDPCASGGAGCALWGGRAVYPALNSTGEFAVFNPDLRLGAGPELWLPELWLPAGTPRDYEIRFTAEGSIAASGSGLNWRVVRVPFEVWDVGPVGPLAEGDPGQAVRLIPWLSSLPGGDPDRCSVGFGHATRVWEGVTYPVTMELAGALPRSGRTYAHWEADAGAVLGETGCVEPPVSVVGNNLGALSGLRRLLFLQAPGAEGAWPGEGTRLRFLTAKPGWAAARLAVDLRREIQNGAFDPASGTAFAQVGDETVPLAPRADWPGVYEGQRVYREGEVPPAVAVRYGYTHAGETTLEGGTWPLNVAEASDLEGVGLDAAYFLPAPFNRVPYDLGPFDVAGLETAQAAGSVVGRAYVLGQPAAPGDVVAAITLRGGVAGAAPVFHLGGEPVVNLLVHGDDGATGKADGVRAGEPFTLHLWDQATGQVRDLGAWLYGWRPYGGRPIPGLDDPARTFAFAWPVSGEAGAPAAPFRLHPAYPNPFAGAATLAFELPTAGEVRLELMDLLGRRVRTLAEGPYGAGAHTVRVDGAGLAAGVYVAVLAAGQERAAVRLTVVR